MHYPALFLLHEQHTHLNSDVDRSLTVTDHLLQKDHISASLQHYVKGRRVKRRGVGVPSPLLLYREEKFRQTAAVVLQTQMAAQPAISRFWTMLAVPLSLFP